MSIYEFKIESANNKKLSMATFKEKVLLIVNTASECGYTYQYEGLEKLHEEFIEQPFEVLGFPCNQFGAQEPGTDIEIQQFCQVKFGVKFPVFKKIDVNGKNTHPLFAFLKSEKPGLLGTEKIKWNFTKFLIDKSGNVIKRYGSNVEPMDIKTDIESLLKS